MKQLIIKQMSKVFGYETAHAHCDIPCGIYDPHQAQISALTVIRMTELINHDIPQSAKDHEQIDLTYNISRAVKVKEEHAEMCKNEIRVIWGDYFKEEHIKNHPNIHELVHNIMQAASKSRQTHSTENPEKLLNLVNEFSEIFWETKGIKTKRVTSPYKPERETVYPIL